MRTWGGIKEEQLTWIRLLDRIAIAESGMAPMFLVIELVDNGIAMQPCLDVDYAA